MRKKGTIAFAVLFGLLCAGSVFMYTQQIEAEAEAQRAEALERYGGDQIEVCVATRDISTGETVDESNAVTRPWLVDLLPADPVTDLSEVSGMPLNSPVVAGEVLSKSRFISEGSKVTIPAGLQAVGVELGAAQAVGGAIQAGSLVDVYASGKKSTTLLAANVLVAAVSDGTSGRLSVTLAVNPDNVEELIAATQATTLYLTMSAKQEGE